MKEVKTKKRGRPTKYSKKLADLICARLSEGVSLRTICLSEDMPVASSVFLWLRTKKGFSEQYARAKEESADAMSEEILDIADDGRNDWMTITRGDTDIEVVNHEVVNRSKLRVDTRKWIMAKMKPKKYGDKLDLTSDNKPLPSPIYGGKSTSKV